MEKIKELFKRYREIIVYVIVGGLTTVVNFVIFYLCKITVGTSTAFTMNLANFLAWVVAVLFAFVTNKLYVFESKSMERKVLFKEFTSFVAARVFSLGAEVVIMNVGVLGLHIPDMICKLFAQVVIILMNYFFSKFVIFKKN